MLRCRKKVFYLHHRWPRCCQTIINSKSTHLKYSNYLSIYLYKSHMYFSHPVTFGSYSPSLIKCSDQYITPKCKLAVFSVPVYFLTCWLSMHLCAKTLISNNNQFRINSTCKKVLCNKKIWLWFVK